MAPSESAIQMMIMRKIQWLIETTYDIRYNVLVDRDSMLKTVQTHTTSNQWIIQKKKF